MKYSVDIIDKSNGRLRNMTLGITKRMKNDDSPNESDLMHNKIDVNDEENELVYQMAVDAARGEYEYPFRRAERFDNKVYILLTVCAFIFVMLTNSISKLTMIDFSAKTKFIYNLIFCGLLFECTKMTIALLIILIFSLSGKKYLRYDSFNILKYDLIKTKDAKVFSKYIIMKYEKARDYNNKLVGLQFDLLNIGVYILIFDVILLIILSFASAFVGQ